MIPSIPSSTPLPISPKSPNHHTCPGQCVLPLSPFFALLFILLMKIHCVWERDRKKHKTPLLLGEGQSFRLGQTYSWECYRITESLRSLQLCTHVPSPTSACLRPRLIQERKRPLPAVTPLHHWVSEQRWWDSSLLWERDKNVEKDCLWRIAPR